MRLKTGLGAAAAALALAAALAHRPAGRPAPARPGHVRGALHAHTAFSRDGGGTLEDVAQAARAAGLSFVVVTDHNTQAASRGEGYHDGVLVLVGMEKSTDAGHALVLGTGPLPFRLDGEPAMVVRDVADLGGFAVAAHPTDPRPDSQWSAAFTGVDGLEVVNLGGKRAWPRGPRLVPLAAHALFDPVGALFRNYRFSREPLDLWDRLVAERPMAGLLGSDAHGGIRLGALFLPFPSHAHIFRLASQHLLLARPLTGHAAADRALVLEALRAGRGWLAFDALADAGGFRLQARSGETMGTVGEALPLEGAVEITAEAGQPGATLVVLRNGKEVARGQPVVHRTGEPGAYRVEAYLGEAGGHTAGARPWIISNPVYLFPPEELRARAERAVTLPAPDALPGVVEPFERFQGRELPEDWQVDHAADAAATAVLEDGALRFDYALGPGPRTHASVCDWRARDLSAQSHLAFRVKAERRTRLDVQVRVEDAASGVRIWRRSARAEREWTQAVIPLGSLRTYDRRGGHPALGRVVGIYFHLDESHLPPGSRGTLWIDDLALGR